MATFYKGSNNGVIAIVTDAVYQKMDERNQLIADCIASGLPRPQLPPITPVFTFARRDHAAFNFMTGSFDMLNRLLEGHTVRDGSIWVPFSNGIQWGQDAEARHFELQFMTSLDAAFEAFGLTIAS